MKQRTKQQTLQQNNNRGVVGLSFKLSKLAGFACLLGTFHISSVQARLHHHAVKVGTKAITGSLVPGSPVPGAPPVEVPETVSDALKAKTLAPGPVLAPSYVLMDVDSGRVLEEYNDHQRMYPASTTKTMTALVAISQGKLDKVVTVGPNAARTGESSVNLMEGEKFALADLVRAALIKSANDSCVAIAEGVAGSVPAFVRLMNQKAKEVGARDTHFANPHGLHDPNHYTTAYDLALIAREAMKYSFFNETIKTHQTSIHGNYKIGPQRLLVNRNRLLFRWDECDGVKTGYTRQAGRCLIASATRTDPTTGQPWRLLAVAMHSPDSWHDCANLLLHEGFEKFHPVLVTRANEVIQAVNVGGGAYGAQAITPRNTLLPLRDDEQAGLSHSVHLFKLTAPIAQGRPVGYMEFDTNGRKLVEVPLVAESAVPASLVTRVMPAAGHILPADPNLRLGLYGVSLLIVALFMAWLKVRAINRTRRRSRTPNRPKVAGQTTGKRVVPER
ncbi:MAG: D-alanyl-D-alanine carboxypeptidase [Abitibacteriaceae bacterium]|nr:D-alanyl-D-alanine carboxypeptidase [Abditibacteriaceae bacterium]